LRSAILNPARPRWLPETREMREFGCLDRIDHATDLVRSDETGGSSHGLGDP
jgi:hypothetical protein